MATDTDVAAFPRLTHDELEIVRTFADEVAFEDGDVVFHAGDPEIDFHVVESGALEIVNTANGDSHVITHEPGGFAGDIDVLTGRPVIVTAIAQGPTRLLRIPRAKLRDMLNRIPALSEKLIVAFMRRRELLTQFDMIGLRVIGSGHCRDTNLVREFLHKNFMPFTWLTPESVEGSKRVAAAGSPNKWPVVECMDGTVLVNPTLHELAQAAGIWRGCPGDEVDLTIVGAGPAGITSAVYAASEGLSTVVLDRLGPGGQVGGSSRIENFIGFPAGLSGTELAMRGVLQMLKFGAKIVAPVNVDKLIPASGPDQLHVLQLDCGAEIRSRVVLIATGVCWRQLEIDGVNRFEGSGVYHACTSVEAGLCDNSDVAVIGAGNSAGQAAMFLAGCCRDRTVHMVIRKTLGPTMSSYLTDRIRSAEHQTARERTSHRRFRRSTHQANYDPTERRL